MSATRMSEAPRRSRRSRLVSRSLGMDISETISVARSERRKLSYREQQELADLPARIEALETRQAELEAITAAPDFYQGDGAAVQATLAEFTEVQATLEAAVERWAALEERAS